jgi:hypothetical protein
MKELNGDVGQAIASLNDIVAQLACGIAADETPSKAWAYTVVLTLAENTRDLGFEPELDASDVADWEEEQ